MLCDFFLFFFTQNFKKCTKRLKCNKINNFSALSRTPSSDTGLYSVAPALSPTVVSAAFVQKSAQGTSQVSFRILTKTVLTLSPPERVSEPPGRRGLHLKNHPASAHEKSQFPPCSVTHARGAFITTGLTAERRGADVPGVQRWSRTRDVRRTARGPPCGCRGNDRGRARRGHRPVTPARSALCREGCGAPRAGGKMAAAAAAGYPAGKGRDISLAALRRHDPYISRIVDVASQVALYTFGHRANEWVRAGRRGRGGAASGRGGPPRGHSGPASAGTSRRVELSHGARAGLSPAERVRHPAPARPGGQLGEPSDGTQPQ